MMRFRNLAAILATTLLLTACGGATAPSGGSSPAPAPAPAASNEVKLQGPIKAGAVNMMTGSGAAYGIAAKEGHDLAMEEINKAGGILGAQLQIIYEDEASKPEQAVAAFTKLINKDNVVAIFGAAYTPSTMAIQNIIQEQKIPAITPVSSSALVTSQGNKWMFRTSPDDLYTIRDLVDYVVGKAKKDKLAILAQNNDLGQSGDKLIRENVTRLGGKILTTEWFNPGDKDFSGQISKLQSAGAEHIFVWAQHPEAAQFARQSKEKGYKMTMYGGTLLSSPKLMELGADAVEGTIFANTFNASDATGKAAEFVKNFKTKFNHDPDNFSAQAYDAVYWLADAIKRAKSADPSKIRDALATTKGFNGVLGSNLSVRDNGDLGYTMLMISVKGGKQVTVKQ